MVVIKRGGHEHPALENAARRAHQFSAQNTLAIDLHGDSDLTAGMFHGDGIAFWRGDIESNRSLKPRSGGNAKRASRRMGGR